MQKMRIRVSILLIAISLVLSGCGKWIQNFYTDEMCEQIAKKALLEKFGEEFEVRSMYTDYGQHFYAVCAPIENNEIVFVAKINKRGEILEENYLESILGKQIRDIIAPEINYMWPSAYINVQKSRINNKDNFDKGYYDILIKDYINETEYPGFALVDIFLPMSDINRYSWDDEYDFWKETIGGLISNREIPDLSIGIWFIDDSRLIKVSDFYHSNDPKFAENEFGDMSFHFGYDDETLDIIISLDEYKAMREGKDE